MEKFEVSGLRISRRTLLIGTAVSAIGVAFGIAGVTQVRKRAGAASHGRAALVHEGIGVSAWVVICPDNAVILKIPQVEIGQGGLTAVAQMLAEELQVRWQDIRTEFYDPRVNIAQNNVYVWTATLGSNCVTNLFDPTRIAAAQIRSMLQQAAAQAMKVPVAELVARDGVVRHPGSGRSMTYAELAAAAAGMPIPDPKHVTLKQPADWVYLGKSVERLDIPSKLDGSACYGIDVRLPGMKYASIRQSPVFGGRLKSFDATAVKSRPGIHAVVKVSAGISGLNDPTPGWGIDFGMDDAVAVVADDWWTANQALLAFPMEWDEGKFAKTSSQSLKQDFLRALDHPDPTLKPARNDGDALAALTHANTVVEGEYWVPFADHATMEPLNCTALVTDDGVEIWTGTQYADEALRVACHYAGVPVAKGRLHLTMTGGGFGRRIVSDYVGQAVQIARTMPGTPIKLLWSREECIRRGYYPPLTVTRLKGGLDADGKLVGWLSRSVGGRAPDQTYGTARIVQTIPNVRVEYQKIETPPPFGWKRGVGFTQHTWMNQSFIDELAHAARKDPYEFQLALLDPNDVAANMEKRDLQVSRVAKQREVIRAVAAIARWHQPAPTGRGKGIAVHDMSYWPEDISTAGAAVAEVSLDKTGSVTVHSVVLALDCGLLVNPDNATAQIQGAVAFALTDVLFAEITLTDGRVDQSNFHDYPIVRLAQMPRVEVHFIKSDGQPLGVGETAVPLTIAAVINAIHAAGGPRVRRLPLSGQDLRKQA